MIIPLLLNLLLSTFTLVEVSKVVSNDRDGQGHHQDPTDGADGADDLPQPGGGGDVAVANLRVAGY